MPERQPRTRNLVAMSPILRKGGAHQRSRSGQRQVSKRNLRIEVEAFQLRKSNGRLPDG